MRRVLFFSPEPGGAATLTPVIRLLEQEKEYEIVVTGYGHGLKRFLQNGVKCLEIGNIAKDDMEVIERYEPDFIITSATSLPRFDMSEKHLWHNARKAGIKTFAFIDQWQNYKIRFSGTSDDETLYYLPDYINCIDSTARTEMISEGFSESILYPLGHPYLTELKNAYEALNPEDIYRKLKVQNRPVDPERTLLFVSEAIREHFGTVRGYDQYQVLEYFLENIRKSAPEALVLVKLHPKDDIKNFDEITSQFKDINPIYCQDDLSSLECLHASNYIFGMTSMMLIEGFILGKVIVSLQPGLKIEDPLVLTRKRKIPLLKDHEEFDVFGFCAGNTNDFNINFDKEIFLNFLETVINY